MTETDYQIRRMTAEDEPAVLDLMRVSLGEGSIPRTAAYWWWKHGLNPFGTSPVLVAEANGGLVGLRAFMRWTWAIGTRRYSAVRAVDTATHPNHRGQGIFKRLTLQLRDAMAAEGVAFVFNTPNAQSRPGYVRMGWSVAGQPTLWMRPVRPVRLIAGLRRGGLSGPEGEPPPIEAAGAGTLLGDDASASILSMAHQSYSAGYHTRSSLAALRWRYGGVPGFEYVAHRSGEGESGALAFARTRQRGGIRELRICDLVVGASPVARTHARRVLRDLSRAADVDMVVALPPDIPGGKRLLLEAGFLPVPRSGPIVTVLPMNLPVGAPDPTSLANWRPSIGDLELF